MGAIHFSLDEKLVEFFTRALPLKLFVETGTLRGNSLELASRFFPECYSVEMSPELYQKASARFQGRPKIHIVVGDSPGFLRTHARAFAALPALFWLDAHWCQAESTSGQTSQSPLLGELAALEKLHPDSVILIDDARLYLCAPPQPHRCADWPDFHAVATALLALGSQHRLMVLNDVLIFYPGRISAAMTEFAHLHGVDWLSLTNQWKDFRERRSRRFPSANFFRHRWKRLLQNRSAHGAD